MSEEAKALVEELRAMAAEFPANDDPPDLPRVRVALDIHDAAGIEWEDAWWWSGKFEAAPAALKWLRAGWTDCSAAECAARNKLTPTAAAKVLRERGLSIADASIWHTWEQRDYPWSDADWTDEARATMEARKRK